MVMDALELHGITRLYADRSGILESLAALDGDASDLPQWPLAPLAVILSPGKNEERIGNRWAFTRSGSTLEPLPVKQGEICHVAIPAPHSVVIELHPSVRGDVGDGEGRRYGIHAVGFGSVYVDARVRGRKIQDGCRESLMGYRSLGVFPDDVLNGWERGTR